MTGSYRVRDWIMRENHRTGRRDGDGNRTLTLRRRAATAICCHSVPICPKPTGDNTIWGRQVSAKLVAVFPWHQNSLHGPNALPLRLAWAALAFFSEDSQMSLHLLLRRSEEARESPPCALWLRRLLALRLQRKLENIRVSCKFPVLFRRVLSSSAGFLPSPAH